MSRKSCVEIAASTRYAAELIELFHIDGTELTGVNVDGWGDINIQVSVPCFIRVVRIAGQSPKRRLDSNQFFFKSHGATWVCCCELDEVSKVLQFVEAPAQPEPEPMAVACAVVAAASSTEDF